VLTVAGLSARYGATPVLDGVDLRVERGELVALLGASGCGKTTLLRIVAGLADASAGTVDIGEQRVCDPAHRVPTRRRKVGLVFQEYALFPDLTVRANVGFAPSADPDHVERLLQLAGLAPLADRYPRQLSGGQQQRVALARALAARPEVLLLDEPFANLDPTLRAELGAELRRLVAEEGCAAVLVTHDRHDALALCDRVAVLLPSPSGGRIAALGAPDALYLRPPSPQVAQVVSEGLLVDAPAVLSALSLDGPAWVRPDQLRFVPGEGPATVRHARFVGPRWEVDGSVGEVVLRAHADGRVPLGQTGRLELTSPPWRFGDTA
jgi:ABC-type sulfate/molybdate transport systems ATPase subunit